MKKNLLNKTKTYLVGHMQYASGYDWRKHVESELKPLDLMRKLLEIENEMGRARSFQNAARIIDIDIIEYGGLFMESAELTLPHPRASQRRFVLEPWFEIEPDGELAGYGEIRQLLSQLQ